MGYKGNCAQAISTHLMIEPDPEPTMTSDEAWAALLSANQEKDLDDFKVFFLEYVRNNKHLTFVDLEKKFRESHFDVYLIAMVTSHTAPQFHPLLSSISSFPLPLLLRCGAFSRVLTGRRKRSHNRKPFVICKAKQE